MNVAEQSALLGPVSNDARALYLLAIRPSADPVSGIIQALNYKHYLSVLNCKEQKFTLGREINTLIEELINAGLLVFTQKTDNQRSFNKHSACLPLMIVDTTDYADLHSQHQAMTMSWTPNNNLLKELCQLMGVIDNEYDSSELGDFKAYWLGRPQALFTPFQWTQKFAYQLKQRRVATNNKTKAVIGTQQATVKVAIEADENAKKLVEKYSKR
ncbi:DnaT-like ssDNA-binding domain-containing protein [Aestuariibacter salexigens]|uniref:DnaT-like ssDNA-binding domain-containing protein n=1 Tax=Aestuariibacter salexigens TaxID=226010 RepID=UPI0004024281|nr:DnaT-like ssDNA-binding domain-containing protein [Aestuariibacter salexigens]